MQIVYSSAALTSLVFFGCKKVAYWAKFARSARLLHPLLVRRTTISVISGELFPNILLENHARQDFENRRVRPLVNVFVAVEM